VLELRALHPEVDRVGHGALQLGLGLHHVDLGGDARVVTILGEVERLLERRDGFVEDALLSVDRAKQQVARRQRRLRRQPRAGEVGRARLRARLAGLRGAPDASPQVELPRRVEARRAVRDGAARGRAADHADGRAAARDRCVGVDRRKEAGARGGHDRLRARYCASAASTVWFETWTCSTSALSAGSPNISHHGPRVAPSCGCATFHSL